MEIDILLSYLNLPNGYTNYTLFAAVVRINFLINKIGDE